MVEFYNGDRSSRYPNDSDMVFDGIPFINAGDLVLGRVKLDTTNKITEEKYNQLSGAKIQCGDIIYCLRGTLGKNAFVDNFDIGTIASSLVDIRPQKIVGKYLFQVLNSDIEYSQRILNDEGAAQPNLSAKNLYLFDIPIPRDAEQIKIAEYLELLDHLITLHQSKSFGHILKAIVSCTLSWEQRKTSDLFKITRGYVLAANITATNKSGDNPYPVYSSQTKDNGLMGYYKDYLYENAITWTTDGANAGTVNYRGEKFYCTNVCGVLLGDKVTPNQMLAEAINNVAKDHVSYVGNPKLMNNVMAEICIWLPSEDTERRAISTFVYSIDHLITLHQLEPFQLIFKAIAYRIIDYTKSKPPSHRK